MDRWAAHQAREMINTIEKQAHDAERMAMSRAHPMPPRSPSFLRETSPTASDSSVELPNLQTSSLVQMWREFESEARMVVDNHCRSPCFAASGQMNSASNIDNASFTEKASGWSEVCDSADEMSYMDWEFGRMSPSQRRNSSPVSDVGDNERVRVADMVRKLTSGDSTHSSFTSNSDVTTYHHKHGSLHEPPSQIQFSSSPRNDVGFPLISNPLRVKGRQATQDFMGRMERERKKELARLGQRRAVSRFSHRSRIQAVLKFRFLQRKVTAQEDQQRPVSTAFELDELHRGSSILQLRERFISRNEPDGSSVSVADSGSSALLRFHNNSLDSESSSLTEPLSLGKSGYFDVVPRDQEITLAAPLSPRSGGEELHEEETQSPHDAWQQTSVSHGRQSPEIAIRNHESVSSVTQSLQCNTTEILQEASQSSDVPWQEGRLSAKNLEWQGDTAESLRSWEGDIMMEESDSDTQEDVVQVNGNWLSNASDLQGESTGHGQSRYNDRVESISDNEEIGDLLDRRTVSTLLASDFRERMDRLILSHLQRVGNHSTASDSIDEDEEHHPQLEEDHEDHNVDQVVYTSVQLPLPSQPIHLRQSRQNSSLTYQPSNYSIEMELIYELRRDMERIHQEVSELRKSMQICMDTKAPLRYPAKHEGSAAAAFRTGEAAEIVERPTRVITTKSGCCICYETQIDSLFYRCGHMCTCFKCACELQWSSGRCPICQAPIVDVVRAIQTSKTHNLKMQTLSSISQF